MRPRAPQVVGSVAGAAPVAPGGPRSWLRRRRAVVLAMAAGMALGAAGWEGIEELSIAPLGWIGTPGPPGDARDAAWTVSSGGAGVVSRGPDGPTLRAWAPAVRVAVQPRGAGPIAVTVHNVPASARLSGPPGAVERVTGTTRVVSGPSGSRWEFAYGRRDGPVTFAVVGDTGASATFEQALRAAPGLGAEFAVVVGDLAYSDRDVSRLEALLERAPVPVYTIRGNHDYASAARRQLAHALGPSRYAFAFGGAEFVMLDTAREMVPGLGALSDRLEWLDRVLADPLGSPVLVFMHKPPLAPAQEPFWHQMLDRPYAGALVERFERAGVSAVFAGHLHQHATWERGGVRYVVSGEGKAPAGRDPRMALVQVRAGVADVRFVSIWNGSAR